MTTPYSPAFYEQQCDISLSSAREVVPYLLSLLPIGSVCDVGCGSGTWLSVFRSGDVQDVLGLDGDYVPRDRLLIPQDCFVPTDLSKAPAAPDNGIQRRFDLAMSLEVAEHLPASAAGGFVRRLTSLSDIVFFSAALPGQGGTDHVNEQWPSYWIKLFADQGFQPIDCLRSRFWPNQKIDLCYRNNMLIFATPAAIARIPRLQALSQSCIGTTPDIVHPERYDMLMYHASKDNLYLSLVLRRLPGLIGRALVKRFRRQTP